MFTKNAQVDYPKRETTSERDEIGTAIRQHQVGCLRDAPRLLALQILHQRYGSHPKDEHRERRVAARRLPQQRPVVRYLQDQGDKAAVNLSGGKLYGERDRLLSMVVDGRPPVDKIWEIPLTASGTSSYEGSDAVDA